MNGSSFSSDYPLMPSWYYPGTDKEPVAMEIEIEEAPVIGNPNVIEAIPRRKKPQHEPDLAKNSEDPIAADGSTSVAPVEDRTQSVTFNNGHLLPPYDPLIDIANFKRLHNRRSWNLPLDKLHASMERSVRRFVEKTLEQLTSATAALHRPTRRFFATNIRLSLVRQAIREQRKMMER